MDWQQKALALQLLVGWLNFSIKMRGVKNWYVQTKGLERKEKSILSSGCTSGITPQDAVEQCCEWATDSKYYLVLNAHATDRRAVKWNGFMWEDVTEEK